MGRGGTATLIEASHFHFYTHISPAHRRSQSPWSTEEESEKQSVSS